MRNRFVALLWLYSCVYMLSDVLYGKIRENLPHSVHAGL